jgi:hypothetical protein
MSGFGIVAIELQWVAWIYNELQLYNSCNLFDNTHNIEIWWVANGHCNSKTELQDQFQNTLRFDVLAM